jgi:hypothetical protein
VRREVGATATMAATAHWCARGDPPGSLYSSEQARGGARFRGKDVLGQLIPPVRQPSLGRRAPAGIHRRTDGLRGARPTGGGGDSTWHGCGPQGSRSAPGLRKERPREAAIGPDAEVAGVARGRVGARAGARAAPGSTFLCRTSNV